MRAWILVPLGFLVIFISCKRTLQRSGGRESSGSTRELVARLTNKDVSWDGTYVGLQPVLGQNAQRVLNMGTHAVPFLLRSVTNRDQYVVAHVLLTKLVSPSFPSDSSHWNLLPIKIQADGRVSYGVSGQTVVRDYWLSHKPVQ
jgi:hypothetical protein